jgi:hypothetical protein
MESITKCLQSAILKPIPILDVSPLPGKPKGKLRLSPEQLLAAIHAQDLANWSLQASTRIQPPRLKPGPGGQPIQAPLNRSMPARSQCLATKCMQLSYIAALAVALAAERCQYPELYRRPSMVLAHL